MSEGANERVGGGGRVAAQGAKVPRAVRLRGSLIGHSQRIVLFYISVLLLILVILIHFATFLVNPGIT